MLFNLNQQRKKKSNILDSVTLGFGKSIPFNPITLPNYQAGYLMNFTTDPVPGSINPILASAQWFDAVVLGIGSKLLNRFNPTTTALVNGFNCQNIQVPNSAMINVTNDIMTNVFDFSFLISFKRGLPGATGAFLLTITNNVNNPYLYLSLRDTTHLKLDFGSGAQFAVCETALNYTDNIWHACVCVIDQINKTVSLYTDKGEVLINTNLLINTALMTPNVPSDFYVGAYSPAPAAAPIAPGFLGDFLIYNSVLDLATINNLLIWEKSRLGI
jgi:hypothetical protein